MSEQLHIPIILATNREGRESENVARWVLAQLEAREGVTTELLDVRDFPLPENGYGEFVKESVPTYRDAITKADGIIIVSPEYNHSFPGSLKTLLDTLYGEYYRKGAGIVSVSRGGWGGVRMTESLATVLLAFGMYTIKESLQFPHVTKSFNDDGTLNDELREGVEKRWNSFIDSLIWTSTALKWGREHLT